jgi:hypothetical protein
VNARGVRVLVGHWGVAVGAKTVAVRVSVGANTEGDRVAVERSVDSPVIKEDWVGMEVASGETVMAEDWVTVGVRVSVKVDIGLEVGVVVGDTNAVMVEESDRVALEKGEEDEDEVRHKVGEEEKVKDVERVESVLPLALPPLGKGEDVGRCSEGLALSDALPVETPVFVDAREIVVVNRGEELVVGVRVSTPLTLAAGERDEKVLKLKPDEAVKAEDWVTVGVRVSVKVDIGLEVGVVVGDTNAVMVEESDRVALEKGEKDEDDVRHKVGVEERVKGVEKVASVLPLALPPLGKGEDVGRCRVGLTLLEVLPVKTPVIVEAREIVVVNRGEELVEGVRVSIPLILATGVWDEKGLRLKPDEEEMLADWVTVGVRVSVKVDIGLEVGVVVGDKNAVMVAESDKVALEKGEEDEDEVRHKVGEEEKVKVVESVACILPVALPSLGTDENVGPCSVGVTLSEELQDEVSEPVGAREIVVVWVGEELAVGVRVSMPLALVAEEKDGVGLEVESGEAEVDNEESGEAVADGDWVTIGVLVGVNVEGEVKVVAVE